MSTNGCSILNQSLGELMGGKHILQIPFYQRGYRWGPKEWSSLWQDILARDCGNEPCRRYLGYVALLPLDDETLEIVEGQQLLTTISIALLAGIGQLRRVAHEGIDAKDNCAKADALMRRYILMGEPGAAGEIRTKIRLNHATQEHFEKCLVASEPEPKHRLSPSEVRLNAALNWFDGTIAGHCPANAEGAKRVFLLLEKAMKELRCPVICASDEDTAYEIIEAINSGIEPRSIAALFKKHLYAMIESDEEDGPEYEAVEAKWRRLLRILGEEPFANFLRCFWSSRNATVRRADLLMVIKGKVIDEGCVHTMLGRVTRAASSYMLLRDPVGPSWNDRERRWLDLLGAIDAECAMAILLATHIRFFDGDRKGFGQILGAVTSLMFRCKVCVKPVYGIGKELDAVARQISCGELFNAEMVISRLQPLYPDDVSFVAGFTQLSFDSEIPQSRKIARHILVELDLHSQSEKPAEEIASYSTEYIWPVVAPDPADIKEASQHERFVSRLGNMTLVTSKDAPALAEASFEQKLQVFANSPIRMSRHIADNYQSWDEVAIADRQRRMAEVAKSVWSPRP